MKKVLTLIVYQILLFEIALADDHAITSQDDCEFDETFIDATSKKTAHCRANKSHCAEYDEVDGSCNKCTSSIYKLNLSVRTDKNYCSIKQEFLIPMILLAFFGGTYILSGGLCELGKCLKDECGCDCDCCSCSKFKKCITCKNCKRRTQERVRSVRSSGLNENLHLNQINRNRSLVNQELVPLPGPVDNYENDHESNFNLENNSNSSHFSEQQPPIQGLPQNSLFVRDIKMPSNLSQTKNIGNNSYNCNNINLKNDDFAKPYSPNPTRITKEDDQPRLNTIPMNVDNIFNLNENNNPHYGIALQLSDQSIKHPDENKIHKDQPIPQLPFNYQQDNYIGNNINLDDQEIDS